MNLTTRPHPKDPRPAVLAVLHGERSTTGRIGRLLWEQGLRLDVRRPRFGDPLPRHLRDHVGAIVFGGPMSANDEHDFVRAEIDWIATPLREEKPFLGVCLGAQMLARALGARVARHPERRVEIGYYPIAPLPEADSICPIAFPRHVYHWHREGFDLPSGARLLARGQDFPVQAMRCGANAYGLQFHPEVTYAMICRWTGKKPERMEEPGACARQAHFDGWHAYDRAVAAWLASFLTHWTAAGGDSLAQEACAA